MPTANPVPSQDPSDLLFNAGKLDEVVNGTANSFTDRLGVARRTVAGMNADFDAQLADAESDLNVYRADAAASAAEALGYLNVIRTTSYGAYASDPATDPLGNPPTVGDEYFNTTANLLKRWNGTTWQASDINTANLAAPSGSSLVGYDVGTVQDVLDAVTGSNGAASIGYTPIGVGAVPMTVEENLRQTSSLLDDMTPAQRNAVKSGAVFDVTAAVQSVLDKSGFITIPDGTYTLGPVLVRSGTTLIFSPKAIFKAKSGFGLNDRLLRIETVTDVTIYGNNAAVQMLKSEYTTGEQRHAVNISDGAKRIKIYDLVARDSGGDGFYIGGDTFCEDVTLFGCIAENNRRQGLSIVNVINLHVFGGHYRDTNGTAPACGIDIESNLKDGYYLQNINIIGVMTSNNSGGGILISPQSKYAPVSINVIGCTSQYDGGNGRGGLILNAAMAYEPTTDVSLIGKIHGKITVRDFNILYPQGSGIVSTNWTENAPETLVENIYVLNPYSNSAVDPADRNKCGMLIRGETPSSGLYGSSIGNITVKNLKVADNRATPAMVIPVYFEPSDEASKPLKNITIDGIEAVKVEWTSASLTPFLRAGSLATTDVVIDYGHDWIIQSASFTPGLASVGAKIATTSSSNFTLPSAANFIGSSFTFRHVSAGNLQVSVQAGDVIDNYSPSAGIGLIARKVGAEITVKAVASGRWQVTNVVGGWGVNPYYGDRIPTTYNTAAPATGTWEQGDIVFNKNAAASGFVGWVCTASGTPGTWKTFGVISA